MGHLGGRKLRFDALTSLRFFAALHVVLYHQFLLNCWKWADAISRQATHWPRWKAVAAGAAADGFYHIVLRAPVAVSLFFVLSGFILAYNYLQGRDGELRGTSRDFFINRFARIYPTYLFGMMLMAPFEFQRRLDVMSPAPLKLVRSGMLNLTLAQAWALPDATTWNFPGWSLSAEAFFYLSFPFLAAWLFRKADGRRIIAIGVSCLLAIACFSAIRQFSLQHSPSTHGEEIWPAMMASYLPLARLPEFLLGVAAGRWFTGRLYRSNRDFGFRRLPRHIVLGISLLPLLILLVLALPEWGPLAQQLMLNGDNSLAHMSTTCRCAAEVWLVMQPAVHAALFCLLIYGMAVCCATGQGRLVPALSWPILVLLGDASYALYILHIPIARYLNLIPSATWARLAGCLHLPGGGAFQAGVYLAIAVAASVIVFVCFETPARQWIRDLPPFRGTRRPAPVSALA
jgi:peptidoglycan/LPS O-acetylase OafA/YrhL